MLTHTEQFKREVVRFELTSGRSRDRVAADYPKRFHRVVRRKVWRNCATAFVTW